jgi:hypothetical protein
MGALTEMIQRGAARVFDFLATTRRATFMEALWSGAD